MGQKPTLDLADLKNKFPEVTDDFGGFLAEACMVCLEQQGHSSGVTLEVCGDFKDTVLLAWPGVTRQMRSCHNDDEVATENGAYAVAFLLIRKLTGDTIIKRSKKGTGFDYYLGRPSDPLFQNTARLEVSGIRQGRADTVKRRVAQKTNQIKRQASPLPAHVIVVEFSKPLSRIANHGPN